MLLYIFPEVDFHLFSYFNSDLPTLKSLIGDIVSKVGKTINNSSEICSFSADLGNM